jgi:hypothetical protein
MKRIIKIGGVEVEKGLCTIDFRIAITNLTGLVNMETTHAKLYELLDTATDVKEIFDTTKGNEVCTFKQGVLEFKVYKIVR